MPGSEKKRERDRLRMRAKRANGGWLPIETAPNTGHMNQILLAWKHRPVSTGWWDVDEDYEDRPEWWVSPEEGWRADGDQCIPIDGSPTHWMPLPPKPVSDVTKLAIREYLDKRENAK